MSTTRLNRRPNRERPAETATCPECRTAIRETSTETYCPDCGLVLDELQLEHREPSQFTEERTGKPRTETLHDRGVGGTYIGLWNDDGDRATTPQWNRLRKHQYRARFDSKAERNLAYGLGEIDRITSAMDVSGGLQEQASVLLRSVQDAGLFRGRDIDGFAPACVVATLRINGRSYSTRDVEPHARVGSETVEMAYTVLQRELDLPIQPPLAADYVPRIANKLDLSRAAERRARELAHEADENAVVNGRSPSAFAAVCCYQALIETDDAAISQEAAADAAGCCNQTIRDGFDHLRETLL